ncbi:unnamed protein product [Trichobilharzia szidati]|nr:unnamed protein product [Trichobilharzia szidati]
MMSRETFPIMLIAHCCYFLLLITVISLTDGLSRCDIKQSSQPESVNCPNKTCSQHIDCWVTYGPPQRCVCDPILCGSVCLPETAKCPKPDDIINGKAVFNDTDVGDIVEYTCNSGYAVRGQRRRHCLATLKWSGTQPTCSNQTETCFNAPEILNTRIAYKIENGKPKIRDDFRSGETVRIECLPGYKDSDNKQYIDALCVGTDWHYTELKCERISCGYIHEPTNGRIHYKYDQKFQSEATVTCSEGFKVMCDTGFLLSTEDGVGCKRVCLENGSWSGEDVYCKVITCPEPQSILNGKHTVSSLTVNGTHISECDDGYELHGSHHRVCQPNGKWSGQEPYCKKRDCGPPPQIQNGEVSYITTTYGSKGRIICENDTTLSTETDEIICGVNGTVTVWNPQPFPQCHRHCYLFTVEHGDVFLIHRRSKGDKQFIQITTAEFGNEDDDVSDEGEHRRLVNEMSDRIILPGGKVKHGSELNVTCQVGYALIKPNQPFTVCQNGVWSVRSKCAPAPCRRQPPVYPGARARFYSLQHNSIARYEAFPGYVMRNDYNEIQPIGHTKINDAQSGILRCLYGEWVGAPLKFEPMHCPHIDIEEPLKANVSIDGKLMDFNSPTTVLQQGVVMIFSCPKEYYLDGPKYIACHIGDWTPQPTTSCKRSPTLSIVQRWLFSSV